MADRLISVNALKFSEVFTAQNREIGVIDDVVIHQDSGQVAYVILKMRGFMGFGDKQFPIPLQALKLDEAKPQRVILNADRKTLKNAPVIEIEELPVVDYNLFMWKIYDYYGVTSDLGPTQGKDEIKLANTMRTRPTFTRRNRLRNNAFAA
ncbi:MAG: hypothetical protein Roseis2KO_02450 [Roseivirga sp.]